MAGSIKGIIVEIGGDTSGLQKALSKVNSATSSLSRELRGINSLLKLDPKNTELLKQKQDVLNESIKTTEDKLKQLREMKEKADKLMAEGTEISAENYRNLQREIINTVNQLKDLKVEASKWTNAGNAMQEFGGKIDGIGNKVGKLGSMLTKTVTPAVAGLTALSVKAFDEVDAGADIVIKKTGATADAAVELKETYKKVAGNVAGSFEEVGNAVGEINTRFGFTNEVLEKASEEFLKFAKVNDVDVVEVVQKVSRYMGDASIESSKYGEVLDNLTSAAQTSGISINTLTEYLTKYGAPMRALGLDTKESIAIFAGWEKAGVNTEIAFSGMKKAIGTWGKEGKDATKEFKKTLEEIKKCPDISSATTKAIEVFGQKAGPDLADAIKGGRFEYSNFLDILEKSNGILDETYTNIMDETDNAQISMKKLKTEFAEIGKEILSTAYPAIEDVLKTIKDLINKFNKLDPELKQNIIKFTALGAVLGPIVKTGGTLISNIGKEISSVGNLCKTVGQVKSGMDVANNSTGLLAKGIAKLTTPSGLAVAGITAVAGALIYLATQETEEQKKAKELAKSIEDAKTSLEEYNKKVDETATTELSHIDNVQKLKSELDTLVDENGKVKKSDEGRAKFIVEQLNEALETEISLTDGQIQNYKDLQTEVDKLIEKKKAEIVLAADEEKYKYAIEHREEATKNLNETLSQLGMSYDEAKAKAQEYYQKMQNGTLTLKEMQDSNFGLIVSFSEADEQIKTYTEQEQDYIEKYALFTEGKYNEVAQTVTKTTQNWTDNTLQEISDSIEEQSTLLNNYKQIYKETGDEVDKQSYEQAQNNLNNLTTELHNRTKTIGDLSKDEIKAWGTLAANDYESFKKGIENLDPTVKEKLTLIADAVKDDKNIANNMDDLAERAEKAFKSQDSTQWGRDMVQGIANGITEKAKTSLNSASRGAAGIIASWLHFSRPDVGPLRDYEKWMPDMTQGLSKTLLKSAPLLEKSTQMLGNKIKKNLNIADFNNYSGLKNKIIDSTKTVFTTPQIVFNVQELDEAKLQQCFNYVNRKFGSQY